jgi:hypothetical protein
MVTTRQLAGRIVLAATGICAATLMVACTGGMSVSDGEGATTSPATPTSAFTSAAAATTSTTSTTSAGQAQEASSGGTARCHTSDLSAAFGQKKNLNTAQSVQGELGALDHEMVALVYTNISKHTCTLFGFGGMDLHGPALAPSDSLSPKQGPVYSARRSVISPTSVRLAPGASAHTQIAYIVPAADPKWVPGQVLVTPPDETIQLRVPWTVGDAVLLFDGGRNWGPTISPVLPGARVSG